MPTVELIDLIFSYLLVRGKKNTHNRYRLLGNLDVESGVHTAMWGRLLSSLILLCFVWRHQLSDPSPSLHFWVDRRHKKYTLRDQTTILQGSLDGSQTPAVIFNYVFCTFLIYLFIFNVCFSLEFHQEFHQVKAVFSFSSLCIFFGYLDYIS